MSKIINIGVLGCASIADKFVIPTVKELKENYNLIGIASRTKKKADQFSEKYSTKAYYNYDELLNENKLDAIYIPLPNSLHYEWIKKALTLGKHVIVEKSLACNYKDVQELNKLAKKKNLVLLENFQFRFHSQLQYIKKSISDGELGEIRNIKSYFGFPPFRDKENIRYKKELGGGSLLDAGAYPIKISQILMGLDIEVTDSNLVISKEHGNIDIAGNGTIRQKNGNLSSQFAFGFDHSYQCSIEIWGSKSLLSTNRIFTSPPGYKPVINKTINGQTETIELAEDNHFKNMLRHFYNGVNGKIDLENEYKQNINQSRLISEFLQRSYNS